MTKGMKKNREQSARASNQKRDPATGRFTRAPHGVVVCRASAVSAGVGGIVPDISPGFERVTPNPNRGGGSTLSPVKPKANTLGGISTSAAERALRVSERPKKKVCLKTRYTVRDISSASSAESTTEESSEESIVNPVTQLKGKKKKMDFWELQKEVTSSQENIMWLEGELKREKKRHTRLQAALKAASDKVKKKTKCI